MLASRLQVPLKTGIHAPERCLTLFALRSQPRWRNCAVTSAAGVRAFPDDLYCRRIGQLSAAGINLGLIDIASDAPWRAQKGSPAARDQPGFHTFPGEIGTATGCKGGCKGCDADPLPTAYRGFGSLRPLTAGIFRELSPRIAVLLFAQAGRGRLSAGKGTDLGAAPGRCRDDAGYRYGVGVAGPCCHPDRVVVRQYPSHEGREDRGEARQVAARSAGQSITRRPQRRTRLAVCGPSS